MIHDNILPENYRPDYNHLALLKSMIRKSLDLSFEALTVHDFIASDKFFASAEVLRKTYMDIYVKWITEANEFREANGDMPF